MTKAVWGAGARLGVVAALLASSISCGDVVRQGTGTSFLIITSIQGASGAEPNSFGTNPQSDVITMVDDIPTVFNDIGRVTFRLGLKDPGASISPNTPTQNDAITITRYRVVYIRTDGRNTPGVDVPYPIDGAFTVTVREGEATASFDLVRQQAKLEAPLRALQFSGLLLSTIAEVTFYGQTLTGHEVSATGRISINFANFGDPDS